MLEWLRRKLGKTAPSEPSTPPAAAPAAPLSAPPATPLAPPAAAPHAPTSAPPAAKVPAAPAAPTAAPIAAQRPTAPAGGAAQVVELSQGVRMHIAATTVEIRGANVACWTYRTEGFARFGQKEFLYALKKAQPQPPADPVHQANAVIRLAAEGQIVGVGAMTAFGPSHPGLFGRPDFRGLGYAYPYFLENALPPGARLGDYLAAIALTEIEVQAAQACGLARVLARMGAQLRIFPYPVWVEPTRGPAIERADLEASVLPKLGGYWPVDGFAPAREQHILTVRLGPEGARQLVTGLNAAFEHNVGLLVPTTAGWDDCVACLTWRRGAQGPTAITANVSTDTDATLDAPGQNLLGCFTVFAAAEGPQGVRMMEDGFGVVLNRSRWDELVAALNAGREFRLEASEGTMGFVCGPR